MKHVYEMARDTQERSASGRTSSDKSAENAEWIKDGHDWAAKMVETYKLQGGVELNLYLHIAEELPTKEAADAFIEGYRLESKRLQSGGSLVDIAAAKQAANLASQAQRVANAVFGVHKKQPDNTMQLWFGKAPEGMVHTHGKAAVLKLLKGPGSVNDKLGSLPTFSNAGRTRVDNKGEVPVQRRYVGVEKMEPQGNADKLAEIMGIPGKLKGKDIPAAKRVNIATQGLEAAVRACPSDRLDKLTLACIGRFRLDEEYMGLSVLMSEWYEAQANTQDARRAHGVKAGRKLVKKAKAETPAEK